MAGTAHRDQRPEQGGPFPLLASPIRLAGLEIPNRVAMSPMSSVLGSEQGDVTPELVAYYKARAEGGTGLVVVEFTCVDASLGRAEVKQLALDSDRHIEGHSRIASAIKAAGSRAALQLHAPGQLTDRRTHSGLPAGPCAEVSRRDRATPIARALAAEEIEGLVASFGVAARRAVEAGYEAIGLHGAHGYLLMAFMSPLKNRRDDEWGGDEERRLRFPEAVVRAVKAQIGPDRPLIYRLSSSDFLPGGLGLEDVARIAPKLVAAGVDAIDVSSGTIEGSLDRTIDPMSMPEAWRLAHSRVIREAAGVPVMAVGPIRWPEAAEAGLARGDLDMVALGRPLLADPDWTRKAIAGQISAIRPCTNCNWCFDRVLKHLPISCAENPRAGNELGLTPALSGRGRHAFVVGGGPGGMAAALDLSQAGFRTTLADAHTELGGGIVASATPPLKDKLFWYRDYLLDRMAESDVGLRLGKAITGRELVAERPDVVVLATGATGLAFAIEGAEEPFATSAYAILMGDAPLPPRTDLPVVVYGGGETGCETAEHLASLGYRVVLVTRSAVRDLARSAEAMYRKHLRARLAENPAITIRELTTIASVSGRSVRFVDQSGEGEIAAAALVIAQGRSTGTDLVGPLEKAGIPYVLVGDVETIGRIGDAVHAARRAVLDLTRRAVPALTGTVA